MLVLTKLWDLGRSSRLRHPTMKMQWNWSHELTSKSHTRSEKSVPFSSRSLIICSNSASSDSILGPTDTKWTSGSLFGTAVSGSKIGGDSLWDSAGVVWDFFDGGGRDRDAWVWLCCWCVVSSCLVAVLLVEAPLGEGDEIASLVLLFDCLVLCTVLDFDESSLSLYARPVYGSTLITNLFHYLQCI